MTEELVKSTRHNVVRVAAFVAYDRFARVADRFQLQSFDATANAFHSAAKDSQESRLAQDAFSPRGWAGIGAVVGMISGGSIPAVLAFAGATWLSFKVGGFLGYIAGTVGGLAWQAPRYKEALSFFRDYEQMRDYRLSDPEKYALLLDFQRIGQKAAKAANVTARFCAVAGATSAMLVLTPESDSPQKPAAPMPAKHTVSASAAMPQLPRVLKPVA